MPSWIPPPSASILYVNSRAIVVPSRVPARTRTFERPSIIPTTDMIHITGWSQRALLAGVVVLLASGCTDNGVTPPALVNGASQFHKTDGDGSSTAKKTEPMGFVSCTDGFAGPFPCSNVDLMALLPTNELCAGGTGADLWGWTDRSTGREYAIQSHGSSTSFVDVTEPSSPVLLGCLPAPSPNFLWRDVEVFGDHAYVTGDAPLTSTNTHGVQIFDLRQLRDIPRPVLTPAVFTETARYGTSRIHTITINPALATGYLAASSACGRTLEIVDLSSPASPSSLGCLEMFHPVTGSRVTTHEAHCVLYSGPDARYHGREICFFANESALHVMDVTDKSVDPATGKITGAVQLAALVYPGLQYAHQGWLAHDQRYFILGDELDEIDNAPPIQNTKTYLFDMADLENPKILDPHVHATRCIDHQLFVRGPMLYQTNYTCGLRVLDARRVGEGQLQEVAYFDTAPTDDEAVFSGAWGSYPYFKSGNVIVSDIEQGLFVLRPQLP